MAGSFFDISDPLIEALYRNAKKSKYESDSSAFWQAVTQDFLKKSNNANSRAICEMSPVIQSKETNPPNEFRRVDMGIMTFAKQHSPTDIAIRLICEFKKDQKLDTKASQAGQQQGIETAKLYMKYHNVAWVYIMTTVGLKFQFHKALRGVPGGSPSLETAIETPRLKDVDESDAYEKFETALKRILGEKIQHDVPHGLVLPSQAPPDSSQEITRTDVPSHPPMDPSDPRVLRSQVVTAGRGSTVTSTGDTRHSSEESDVNMDQ